jgi:hypothetical protein
VCGLSVTYVHLSVCARARAHRARRPHIDVVTLKHPPVEEPLRFVEGSAVASSSCDAEPRCLRLLGLARVLPMDFNES